MQGRGRPEGPPSSRLQHMRHMHATVSTKKSEQSGRCAGLGGSLKEQGSCEQKKRDGWLQACTRGDAIGHATNELLLLLI